MYVSFIPDAVDQGVAVGMRYIMYRRSFDEVDEANKELSEGKTDQAEQRLQNFLLENGTPQPDQLMTNSVVAAHMLLADLYHKQGKSNKAIRLLNGIVTRVPLHYRIWHLLGILYKDKGDYDAAKRSFHHAFKLAPNHPLIVEHYLEVLAQLGEFDSIVWVYDQFQRALKRAAPTVQIRAGSERPYLQRYFLQLVDLPVEHGLFTSTTTLYGLKRGNKRVLKIPNQMLTNWFLSEKDIYIQLRFENIYDGLVINGLQLTYDSGRSQIFQFNQQNISYFHQQHSGSYFIAEFPLNIELTEVVELQVIYSCPVYKLSSDAMRIIEKAKLNIDQAQNPK